VSLPIINTPGATSRLNHIIHQSDRKEMSVSPATSYSIADVQHRTDEPSTVRSISMKQNEMDNSCHQNDDKYRKTPEIKLSQSILSSPALSCSSSSASSVTASIDRPTQSNDASSSKISSVKYRNPNVHRSVESLQRTYKQDAGLKPSNRTASLDFALKPVSYDESGD
jgi:hypothetical protein